MKKNYIKFSLDVLMAVLFVLFFNKRVLGGLAFHEIAGLVFAVMYFTHIFLNLQWVKNVTLKIFDRKLPWKTRGNYLLNLLLLIMMSFIIISGIIISRIVFPNFNLGNENWFKMTHISVSFLVLLLIGIHVGLHWHWVVNVWKKIINFKSKQNWIGYTARVVTVLILVFGVYEVKQTGFLTRVASATNVFSTSSQQMGEGHEGKPMMKGNFDPSLAAKFKNGEKPPEGFKEHEGGEGREGGGGANVLNVILTYTGVMSVFVIVTYYLRKITVRTKRRKMV